MKGDWLRVGEIGVDAGMVMVGDPCYLSSKDHPVHDWPRFVDSLGERTTQLKYALGHDGLGVVVDSGYGDGVYPVFVKMRDDGTVKSLKVEF